MSMPTTSTVDRLLRGRAKRVRALMWEAGVTDADIAAAAGRSRQTVEKCIAGRNPSPAVVDELCRRLGQPFIELWLHYPDSGAAA